MKYIKQIAIIGFISFLGEVLNVLLPLPVPASVYGLVILLICLYTGIVKLAEVEAVSEFLISIMPIMFISPTVSIMQMIGDVKGSILGIFVTCIISTVLVMVVTGWVAQIIMKLKKNNKEEI